MDGLNRLWSSTKSTVALAMACLALSVLLFSIRAVSVPVALAGLAIIWLSILPTLLYLRDGDFSVLPFLPMVGIFYLLFFGIPVFVFQYIDGIAMPRAYEIPLVENISLEPFLLIAAGLAVQTLAFVTAKSFFFRSVPDLKIATTNEPRILSALAWVLLVAHLVYKYVPQMETLSSAGQFLEPSGYVAFALLLLLWAAGNLTRLEAAMFFVVALPLEIYVRVKTIFLTQVLLLCLAGIFVLWKMRAFKTLGAVTVLGFIVMTGYSATAGVRDPAASRFNNFYNVASAYVNAVILGKPSMKSVEGDFVPLKSRFGPLIQRTAHSWIFHRVFVQSPSSVPYWGGETYLPLLTSLIPRVLYPNKPEERAGLKFGVTYGLIVPNSITSVNIPWITELLMNFGSLGVIGGMAIFGLFLAFLDRVFNAPGIGPVEFAIGLPLLLKFVYPESNFSVTVGSTPLMFVCLYFYFYVGTRGLRRLTALSGATKHV